MVTPRVTQVPPTSLAAFFTSYESRSVDFCSATFLTCSTDMSATKFSWGSPLPEEKPASSLMSSDVGGTPTSISKEPSSSYSTVIGTSIPSKASVSSLISCTTACTSTGVGPSSGPSGGPGLACPPGTSTSMVPAIYLCYHVGAVLRVAFATEGTL